MENNQTKVSIKDGDVIKCECGSTFFEEIYFLRKYSKLVLREALDDQIVPFPVHKCIDCGKVINTWEKYEGDEPTKLTLND